jgi:pimeloyl-ACP methyl ester carboxylesterase
MRFRPAFHIILRSTFSVLLFFPAVLSAQTPPPAEGSADLVVIVGGTQIGREQVHLARTPEGWIITGTGRYAAPVNLTINRFELKYTPDWQPVELQIDAAQNDRPMRLSTSFAMTSAINEITQGQTTSSRTDQISPRTIVLANNFYAGYEALAARLAAAAPGTTLPVYVAPQGEIQVAIKAVTPQKIQTPAGAVTTRRYDVVFQNPGAPLAARITVDDRSRFVRLEIPDASLVVARADLSSVATRAQTTRNPTDTDITIPASGFSLAGTLTLPPAAAGRLRHPAIVLLGGSGQIGRDGTVAGISVFAQLAGGLANRGFAVVRYDKRGVGQSGGRAETVTLEDYADDAIAAVRWLASRKDIDSHRITLVGHSEGGAVAMIAASREKKIASLVLVAAPGTTGADLVLEQQLHVLDLMNTPPAERQAKIDLQRKIQTAVMTEKGWDAVPPDLRRQADSAWFRSFLLFDPAKTMKKIKQPILIVQGDLDKQILPSHADRLADLASARKKVRAAEAVHVPGVNHLLVPAVTGEVSEYGSLSDKTISPSVVKTIADWLHAGGQMK